MGEVRKASFVPWFDRDVYWHRNVLLIVGELTRLTRFLEQLQHLLLYVRFAWWRSRRCLPGQVPQAPGCQLLAMWFR